MCPEGTTHQICVELPMAMPNDKSHLFLMANMTLRGEGVGVAVGLEW